MLLAMKTVNVICAFLSFFFTVIIVVSLTLKNIKLANLHLPTTQFNSKDSIDLGNFFCGKYRL